MELCRRLEDLRFDREYVIAATAKLGEPSTEWIRGAFYDTTAHAATVVFLGRAIAALRAAGGNPSDQSESSLEADADVDGFLEDCRSGLGRRLASAAEEEGRWAVRFLMENPASASLWDSVEGDAGGDAGRPKYSVRKAKRIEWIAKALWALRENPEWSDAQIAREAGTSPSQLSRCEEFQAARLLVKSGKGPRRGFATRGNDGKRNGLEAYDDERDD